jgi:putative two-component system response regulator
VLRVEVVMVSEVMPSLRITVVEDEFVAQDVLVRAAQSWRYECQVANTAEQALSLLEEQPTPIVVTDLRMPGQGGLWLVQEIRKRWPEVAIIVITGGHDPDSAEQCLRAGANHYFFKPIRLEEFHHVLETSWRTYHEEHHRRRMQSALRGALCAQIQRVRRTFLSGIHSLVRTMEERDPYTAGHSQRVRRYALALARELGLDQKQRRRLSLAARLHDIGKVAIADAILLKPGPLTGDEYAIIREHPAVAERILTPIVRNRAVLEAIRGHHERPDGKGYPDGLSGEGVPLLSRLIAIPDCFDALTTTRAYRAARSVPEALAILQQAAGTQFDPNLVRTFVGMVPSLLA